MYNPLVSIVIPVYNGSNYLAEAIESALSQTYENIEIIVVNDGSKDDGATAAVAARYADKIRYFEKENGGSSSALNLGIREMKGEWFSWLSHDDLYYPEKVAKQIAYLESLQLTETERRKHVVFAGSELVNAAGMLLKRRSDREQRQREARINRTQDNAFFIAQPRSYTIHGCSCLIHRQVFDQIGMFDETLRYLNDAELWFRIYGAGYVLNYVPETLVRGRVHPKQVGRTVGYTENHPEGDLLWRRRLAWLIENRPGNYLLFELYGRHAFLSARYQEAHEAFRIAGDLRPDKKLELLAKKTAYMMNARMRTLAKKVFVTVNNR